MFCSRCGAEQPESARFCEHCGHRHEVVPPQRAGRWWIGGAVALALALAGAAVLAATGTFESDDEGNNRVETDSVPEPSTVADTAPDTTADRAEPSPETETEAAAGGEQPARATVQGTCGRGGVGGDCVLSVRAEPTAASAEIDVLDEGDSLRLSCQVRGEPVSSSVLGASSNVWSRTTLGGYVANVYVAGPGLSPLQITLAPC